jgi:hypothetical protein
MFYVKCKRGWYQKPDLCCASIHYISFRNISVLLQKHGLSHWMSFQEEKEKTLEVIQ